MLQKPRKRKLENLLTSVDALLKDLQKVEIRVARLKKLNRKLLADCHDLFAVKKPGTKATSSKRKK